MDKKINHFFGRERSKIASFTLMELLAVITIIAVLAGLIFPAYNSMKNSAKSAKARQDVNNLKIALLAFRQEYGYWPTTFDATWADLSSMLNAGRNYSTGNFDSTWATNNNCKAIRFMDFKPEQLDPTSLAFIDPWGTPYAVLMDNGDKAIGKSVWKDPTAEDGQVNDPTGGGNPIQSPVAVYSFGPNKIDNNGTSDDITSWGK